MTAGSSPSAKTTRLGSERTELNVDCSQPAIGIEASAETGDVGIHVDDRLAGDARIHRGLGDGGGDVDDEPGIERGGDDVVGPEGRATAVEGRGDLVGHLGARQLGERLGRRNLHGFVDGRGLHVERPAEDEGEAQHVIDLVGVVGPPRRHDGVIAHGGDVLGRDLWIGIRHGEDDGLRRHRPHHLTRDGALDREAEQSVGTIERFGQRARLRLDGVGRLPLVHALLAALEDDTLGVAQDRVGLRHAHGNKQLEAGDAGGAGAVDHELEILEVAAGQLERIEEAGGGDDGGAVLVVVEDGDVEHLLQLLLDDEAVGGLDVLQVDAAEGGAEVAHGVDERVGVLGIDEEVDGVDVGEALEQGALAFHHGLGSERSEIAEAEDGRAVRDHGDEVALVGVVVHRGRVLRDGVHGHGDARRIGERQVALGGERLGRRDFELARLALGVELKGFLIGELGLRGLGASVGRHRMRQSCVLGRFFGQALRIGHHKATVRPKQSSKH